MLREGLIFVGTCDIAGLVRGKGFPARALKQRQKTGIGWTHSNLMHTCFGLLLDTPFGTAGDLMIVPDPTAEVDVDFGDGSAPPAWHPIVSSPNMARASSRSPSPRPRPCAPPMPR
jgi:glutamine synthetase